MNLKLVSGLVLCGAFAVACGDSGSNTGGGTTTDGGNTGEGGSGASSGVLTGGGNDPVGAGDTGGAPPEAPDCYDGGASLVFADGFFSGVTINQNLCTPTQTGDAFTACVGTGATQETCDAFTALDAANQTCLNCLLGDPDAAGAIPMIVTIPGDMYQWITTYACQAQAMGLPQCAVDIQNLIFCSYTSCEACAEDQDANNECVNYALNDPEVCGALPLDAACEPIFAVTEIDPLCDGGATTFEQLFGVVGDYYCGAP